jgi:hypothetical protein
VNLLIDTNAKTRRTFIKKSVKNLYASFRKHVLNTSLRLSWRNKLNKSNPQPSERLSADAIEVRIWAFVVVAVTLILSFIVGALLYSVTFVEQPIKAMAPIDQAYTKMLNDIVLLIVGGIGGIMGKRAVSAVVKPEPKEVQDAPTDSPT